jgi:hypothetical protein
MVFLPIDQSTPHIAAESAETMIEVPNTGLTDYITPIFDGKGSEIIAHGFLPAKTISVFHTLKIQFNYFLWRGSDD